MIKSLGVPLYMVRTYVTPLTDKIKLSAGTDSSSVLLPYNAGMKDFLDPLADSLSASNDGRC